MFHLTDLTPKYGVRLRSNSHQGYFTNCDKSRRTHPAPHRACDNCNRIWPLNLPIATSNTRHHTLWAPGSWSGMHKLEKSVQPYARGKFQPPPAKSGILSSALRESELKAIRLVLVTSFSDSCVRWEPKKLGIISLQPRCTNNDSIVKPRSAMTSWPGWSSSRIPHSVRSNLDITCSATPSTRDIQDCTTW